MKSQGWRREPARHALAAKGISTRYNQARLARVRTGGVGLALGRRGSYARMLKKLARGYSDPPTEVGEADYESAVNPLFLSLAEADELVDRGELKSARDRLTMVLDQYATMEQTFPVISASDAADFQAATDAITRKLLAASRGELKPVNTIPRVEARESELR